MARIPIRKTPRISVNDLALYMVSSDTARIGILTRSKRPQTSPIIRYRDVRKSIRSYLVDDMRSVSHLNSTEQLLLQKIDDPTTSSLMKDDAKHSIEVLHDIQSMSNKLSGFTFVKAPHAQDKLEIGGVSISVYADVLVHSSARGKEQIGAGMLRMTMDDAETESAKQKRKNIGLYVATLARLHVDQNITSNRDATNKLCMSIDVQHGEVFQAPNANTRRMNDIQNACKFITSIWDSV